jgi:lipoate-protein ligase A
MKKYFLVSKTHNPYENMALEHCIMESVQEDELVMMIYVNDPSIIIGRHQNPWQEIQMERVAYKHVPIVRRLSGGGTVYHDRGNINFAFIYKKGTSDIESNFNFIIETLKNLGIDAYISNRKDIRYRNFKISGNAFYQVKDRYLHHGTLLIHTDLSNLWSYLKFNHTEINSHSVASVKSQVKNLNDINGLTMNLLLMHLSDEFAGQLKDAKEYIINKEGYESLVKKYASWDWIFGETPKFEYKYINVTAEVEKGKVKGVTSFKLNNLIDKNFDETCFIKEVNNVHKTLSSS